MSERREEQFCRKALDEYFAAKYGAPFAQWEPEPNGETTPPDYSLDLCGVTYAVEMTTLMSHYEQTKGKSLSELGVWKMSESLAAEIEREMNEMDLLRGYYILTLDGPYDFFIRSRSEIKTALKTFIAETLDKERVEMDFTPRVTKSGQSFFLQKVDIERNGVGIVTMGGNEGWECEVFRELFALVCDAIVTKAQKLRFLTHPWILVLLDQHDLATVTEYEKIRDRLAILDSCPIACQLFDLIFIINAESEVYRLDPFNETEPSAENAKNRTVPIKEE